MSESYCSCCYFFLLVSALIVGNRGINTSDEPVHVTGIFLVFTLTIITCEELPRNEKKVQVCHRVTCKPVVVENEALRLVINFVCFQCSEWSVVSYRNIMRVGMVGRRH